MTITEHPESFEVRSDDGAVSRQFPFDNNPSRRAISGQPNRKRALQEARTFAGAGAKFIPKA